jgi:2-polyprenyl-3-methyl-5-hydroxy-6-metoxy-1,4-benzoquinol methylase
MGRQRHHKEPYLLSLCRPRSRILHVGCTNSPNTQARIRRGDLLHAGLSRRAEELSATLIGIDIDQESIDLLHRHLPQADLRLIDAHDLAQHFLGDDRFDLIIAGDVIEHLPDPGRFLVACRQALRPDGRLVISTANAFGLVRFLKMIVGHEAVHPEHTAYYSIRTLARLLQMTGYRLDRSAFYRCEPIQGPSNLVRRVGNAIEVLVCWMLTHLSEGIIVEAVVDAAVPPARIDHG